MRGLYFVLVIIMLFCGCRSNHSHEVCENVSCGFLQSCVDGRCVYADEIGDEEHVEIGSMVIVNHEVKGQDGEVVFEEVVYVAGQFLEWLVVGVWSASESRFLYQIVDKDGNLGQYVSIVGGKVKSEPVEDEEGTVFEGDNVVEGSKFHLGIAYYDSLWNRAKYAWTSGGQWKIEVIDDTESVGEEISAVFEDGKTHVAYRDKRYRILRYGQRVDELWNISVVDNAHDSFKGKEKLPKSELCPDERRKVRRSGVGLGSSIAIQGGLPVISYFDADCGGLRLARQDAGGSWRLQVIDKSKFGQQKDKYPFPVGRHSQLLMDKTGALFVVYSDGEQGILKQAEFKKGKFEVVVADDGVRSLQGGGKVKHIVGLGAQGVFHDKGLIIFHKDALDLSLIKSSSGADGWVHERVANYPELPKEIVVGHGQQGLYLIYYDEGVAKLAVL